MNPNEVATNLLSQLMDNGGSVLDILDAVSQFNGMVSCGLAFSVKNCKTDRSKAYKVQQDIAKATRAGIEAQPDEVLEMLSFADMFEGDDENVH